MEKSSSRRLTMPSAFEPKKKENWLYEFNLFTTQPPTKKPSNETTTTVLGLIAIIGTNALTTRAADATPPKPTMEDRVADLEAYVTNGARQTNAATALATSPGPGHNGWQMTSTALVLFMTLPGLALFYGGLVRRKNVLSVLAQCLGITGLVTILWVVCGYSMAFHSGNAFIGKLDWAFLKGVDSTPNTDYGGWVSH